MNIGDREPRGVHDKAVVEDAAVGLDTTIGPFAFVEAGSKIGAQCRIMSHAVVEAQVELSDRVSIGPGARLCGKVSVGTGTSIGANACFDGRDQRITVHEEAVIGPGACVAAGISIGREASIAAGAVIDHDVPAFSVVEGNPARIVGYAGTASVASPKERSTAPVPSRVRGVESIELPVITDMHGRLAVAETGAGLPFEPRRYFVVHDVPSREVRGEHAHRTLHQVLTCVRGECSIIVDDGLHREQILLNTPGAALHIGPMVWAAQFGFSQDAVLLVLASDPYDPEDYIRDYNVFREAVCRG